MLALAPGRGSQTEARREELGIHYLRGEGIEIGALHRPLWTLRTVRVRYVDVMSRGELLSELNGTYDDPRAVVETDIVDDGERLDGLAAESVDFVIANHVLEHAEDPIAALGAWSRVVRPGGFLFITVPDRRYTFDARRPRTTVEHLLEDHRLGAERSREEHYREWAQFVEGLPAAQIEERVAQFHRERPRLHFHVWELDGFLAMLRALELPLELEAAQAVESEFTVILRKRADA